MKQQVLSFCLIGFLMSCSTASSITHRNKAKLIHNKPQAFWVGDVTQNKKVNKAKVCHKKKLQQVDEVIPLNALLTVVTLGMYSPRHARADCQ